MEKCVKHRTIYLVVLHESYTLIRLFAANLPANWQTVVATVQTVVCSASVDILHVGVPKMHVIDHKLFSGSAVFYKVDKVHVGAISCTSDFRSVVVSFSIDGCTCALGYRIQSHLPADSTGCQ